MLANDMYLEAETGQIYFKKQLKLSSLLVICFIYWDLEIYFLFSHAMRQWQAKRNTFTSKQKAFLRVSDFWKKCVPCWDNGDGSMNKLTKIKVSTCPVIAISFGNFSSFSVVKKRKTSPSFSFLDYLLYKSLSRTDLTSRPRAALCKLFLVMTI